MSLRDQLLAKGLVSKKRARAAGQEAKKARKDGQGSRRKKKLVEREQAAEQAAIAAAEKERRAEARREHRAVNDAHDRVQKIRALILSNRMGARGAVPFWHRRLGSLLLGRLQVPVAVARDLRNGNAAVVGLADADGPTRHFIVPRRTADRLLELEPSLIVHLVTDTENLRDPSETLVDTEWEPSLGPHRLRGEGDGR